MYTILIHYETGDTFSTKVLEEKVGCCWESKKLAQKALQAIKKHNSIYEDSYENSHISDKIKNKKASKYSWYNKKSPEFTLSVEIDSGERKLISAFWLGYFETLYGAEIILE